MGPFVAGIDCSTQATKVVVVDPDSGEIRGIARAKHEVSGVHGARETDPREWWNALRAALAETGLANDIGALSVAGQQHGLVTLDARGDPLRPAILWNDTRSGRVAEALLETLGAARWAEQVGSRLTASFTVTKWVWLRQNEPETASATAAIRLPHDYLTERLTGSGTTDRGDASGTGWWSTRTGTYAEEVLALPSVDLDTARVPIVLRPDEPAGHVRPSAAAELSLDPGVVVGPGTGDNMAAALGLGLSVGQPVVSLGTSGTVFAVSERRPADPTGVVAGFADATGHFLPLACTLNCTVAVDRVAAWLGLDRDDVEPTEEVVFLPYFDGERTPNLPAATATVSGLRHTTRPQQILMATYEGAVASLLEALSAIEAQVGGSDPNAPLALVGGGSRGRVWREVVGRLSGRRLLVPHVEELVALGAAAQAAAVWRGEDATSVARRWRTTAGTLIDAVPRDDRRTVRIRSVREAAVASGLLGEHN
jgi:xylulokinase